MSGYATRGVGSSKAIVVPYCMQISLKRRVGTLLEEQELDSPGDWWGLALYADIVEEEGG